MNDGGKATTGATGAKPGKRDRPWIMRTYDGHSSPAASYALFRENLPRAHAWLSHALGLPTHSAYDPRPPLERGHVG